MMNSTRTPMVTPLIRACKSGEKNELNQVINYINEKGISKDLLNSVDKNGRTALSYICVQNLPSVLDFLLRLPGVDVNKPDTDGNTPLHFVAEIGHPDMITTLITRSTSLVIDLKNVFGITPLMKAAIQGRTDCSKRIILAKPNSALVRDSVRGLTAKEWAYLCGRRFCGDAIGQLIRQNKQKNAVPKKYSTYNITDTRKAGLSVTKIDLPDLMHSVKSEPLPPPTIIITPAESEELIKK
ncbi:hypothetical protein HA402_011742 [Bradysia odoriphaga]|nr:hypothetical protein HA402_011742 [Bradysia odoriphaga]